MLVGNGLKSSSSKPDDTELLIRGASSGVPGVDIETIRAGKVEQVVESNLRDSY